MPSFPLLLQNVFRRHPTPLEASPHHTPRLEFPTGHFTAPNDRTPKTRFLHTKPPLFPFSTILTKNDCFSVKRVLDSALTELAFPDYRQHEDCVRMTD